MKTGQAGGDGTLFISVLKRQRQVISVNSKPAWSMKRVSGQPGLHRDPLCGRMADDDNNDNSGRAVLDEPGKCAAQHWPAGAGSHPMVMYRTTLPGRLKMASSWQSGDRHL